MNAIFTQQSRHIYARNSEYNKFTIMNSFFAEILGKGSFLLCKKMASPTLQPKIQISMTWRSMSSNIS